MLPTTNRITIAAALAVASLPAFAQSGAPIPEGRAFVCSYESVALEVKGKRRISDAEAQGVVTSKLAYHCTAKKCYRFQHSPELSQKTQIYNGDDGIRLMTNGLALHIEGGVTIFGLDKRSDAALLFYGRCIETSELELADMIEAVDKRAERSKPKPKR